MKKRIFSLIIAMVIVLLNFSVVAFAAEEGPFSHAIAYSQAKDFRIEKRVSAVGAIEYETGKIIIDTNINEKFCPEGNTAMLMSVYAALATIKKDSVIVAQNAIVDPNNNQLQLTGGMEAAVSDLVAAAMYYNDANAITALALACDNTVEEFVARINKLASSLKMENTHFTNITGKYDENQYTTVSDYLALVYMCYNNETLTNITSSKKYFVKTDKILATKKNLSNSFPFIDTESEYYNGNIFGIGTSKDSKGVTTSIVTYVTAKQKFIFIIRSPGNTFNADIVDTLDFLKKNYALIDISKIIFELGDSTSLDINGEKVHFSAVKNSVSNVNVVANLYYSKSVSTVNDAYSVKPPDVLPESVQAGDIIKGFKIMYNGNQISTVNLMVKAMGEQKEEEKTLGFTVYQEEDVHLKKGSFLQEHSWMIIVCIVAVLAVAAIIIINRLNKI